MLRHDRQFCLGIDELWRLYFCVVLKLFRTLLLLMSIFFNFFIIMEYYTMMLLIKTSTTTHQNFLIFWKPNKGKCLEFETTGSSATSGSLLLSSFGSNEGTSTVLGVAEILVCFACRTFSSDQQCVGSFRILKSKLIERKAFTTCFQDSRTSGLRESESTDSHGRNFRETGVVENGTYEDGNLLGIAFQKLSDTRDRHGGTVIFRHV